MISPLPPGVAVLVEVASCCPSSEKRAYSIFLNPLVHDFLFLSEKIPNFGILLVLSLENDVYLSQMSMLNCF